LPGIYIKCFDRTVNQASDSDNNKKKKRVDRVQRVQATEIMVG